MKKLLVILSTAMGCGVLFSAEVATRDPELFTRENSVKADAFSGIFPPQVKTIAIISPASTPAKPFYRKALDQLLKSNLKIKVGKHVFAPPRPGMSSAPLEDRLADFYAAWNDPEVDFILCMRGGEGCTELLNALDWSKLADRPGLYFQGYSDVTQIICAMQSRKLGRPIAGPMVGAMIFLPQECLEEMRAMHHGKVVGPVPLTPLVPGNCRGRAIAGLLERFKRSFNSANPPDLTGRIIFIESVGKSVEANRELLNQLLEQGFFQKAAGVVFCHFTRCGSEAEIAAMLAEIAPKLGVPVYSGFPFGHAPDCYTIDFQREVVIESNALTFPATE